MKPHSKTSDPHKCDLCSDTTWQKLYLLLRPLVKRWVLSSGVSSWKGQENDIVDDIVQEAILKTLKYAQRAEQGEVAPIASLEHMSIVIARNCCKDMRRKDYRLTRIDYVEQTSVHHVVRSKQVDASDIAVDNMFREWLFVKLSQDIVNFPDKQRKALLVDLANRMDFGGQPTLLQQAFLKQKINLKDYRQPLPLNSVQRSRHASLVTIAYKRVSQLNYV